MATKTKSYSGRKEQSWNGTKGMLDERANATASAIILPGPMGMAGETPTITAGTGVLPGGVKAKPRKDLRMIFRPYQWEAFNDRKTGIEVWLWSRQVGKSFTLAAWAIDRLIVAPGRTVTMLSNSKFNGMELNRRCAEVCRLMGQAFEQVDLSIDDRFETMRTETRITIDGETGRILVLAANPETARSFSGDLILDEFAFHRDGKAIWAAAEPIISGNPDYLCRIASTPNGKHNEFYRVATDPKIPRRVVTRTRAHAEGCPIYHPVTREKIGPAEARALAANKRVYDQNYECVFEDDNMALLTHELINAAERADGGVICNGDWSEAALAAMKAPRFGERTRKTAKEWLAEAENREVMERHLLMKVCNGSGDRLHILMRSDDEIELDEIYGPDWVRDRNDTGRFLYAGVDVGRQNDRSVVTVIEKNGSSHRVVAILRMEQMRFPDQKQRLETILNMRDVRALKIDMTGLGLGLFEFTQEKHGEKMQGVNFSSSVPVTQRLEAEGNRNPTVRVTEMLATQLLQVFEDRSIQIPIDDVLRDDLRKPERVVTASGRVSIAATRDEAGHADHFWSLALAIDAAKTPVPKKLEWVAWVPKCRERRVTL